MALFPNLLFETVWPGLATWVVLYISDYYLTLICARLYRAGINEKIALEGSYEITPYFQADIDALRTISWRFLRALVCGGVLLVVIWELSVQSDVRLYEFWVGALISSELAIHVRHFRNLALFRMIAGSDAVRGRIEYSRFAILQSSMIELLAFAGLFVVVFVFTQSWFVLGGSFSCLSIAWKHHKLAQAQTSSPAIQTATK